MGKVLVLVLLCASAAQAHHSFAAEFDVNKPVHLTGAVTRVEWNNPHAFIYMKVAGREWAIEAAAPNAMLRRGLTKNDLRPGTEIVADGFQAKDGSNRAEGQSVTLSDGRQLFLRYQPGG